MKILIAPDKFKHAVDAAAVADAMAAGARDALPDAEITLCPMADGGDGTGPTLAAALGATARHTRVADPLGRPHDACWWFCSASRVAVIEMAQAAGLALLAEDERDALRATTFGVGELILAATDAGAEEILVGVGGSATVDGGAGCLQALGWRLLDADGATLAAPAGGGDLHRVARLEPPTRADWPRLRVLCDVDHPLTGPRGAAVVFGPQKGATEADVAVLDAGLTQWARVLTDATGCDVSSVAGMGAAGGLPAALTAALGARLEPGVDVVADCIGLRGKLAGCALCLTGEGRLDAQTAGGKVVAGVARLAREAGTPAVALVGAVTASETDPAASLGLDDVVVVTPAGAPVAEALAGTCGNVRRAVRDYCRRRFPNSRI